MLPPSAVGKSKKSHKGALSRWLIVLKYTVLQLTTLFKFHYCFIVQVGPLHLVPCQEQQRVKLLVSVKSENVNHDVCIL
jgi:hypothetical protein